MDADTDKFRHIATVLVHALVFMCGTGLDERSRGHFV